MKTPSFSLFLLLATTLAASAQRPDRRGGHRPPPASPLFAVIDTDRDGVLSAEEVTAASEAIAKLDENGDGEITLDELRLPPPRRNPKGDDEDEQDHQPAPKPPVQPVIAVLDKDHDGTLSASELEAAPESLKELDVNGDGELSPEELRPQGPPQGPPPGEEEDEVE